MATGQSSTSVGVNSFLLGTEWIRSKVPSAKIFHSPPGSTSSRDVVDVVVDVGASVVSTVLLDSSDSSVNVQVEELVVQVVRLEDVVVTEMLLLVLVVETSNSQIGAKH